MRLILYQTVSGVDFFDFEALVVRTDSSQITWRLSVVSQSFEDLSVSREVNLPQHPDGPA